MYGSIGSRDDNAIYVHLCETVSRQVFQINSKAGALSRFLRQLSGPDDCDELREKIHRHELETNTLIESATNNLRQLSEIARGSQKAHKMQVDKLRHEFQERVTYYSSLQQQIAVKVKAFSVPHFPSGQGKNVVASDANPFIDPDDPFDLERLQQVQTQKQSVLAAESDLQAMKQQRILQLESDILNIHQIFKDLGEMVSEQGDVVNTIEANIETAYGNVVQADNNLAEAEKYSHGARKKRVCCVLLVIVVLGVLALAIWLSLKH